MTSDPVSRPMPLWLAAGPLAVICLVNVLTHLRVGYTDGEGRPLGDDFINFWSAPVLALSDRAGEIYDLSAFHAFEQAVAAAPLHFRHYTYPPVLLVLTAPLAALPYVPALVAWLLAGWSSLIAALRLAMPVRRAVLVALTAPAVVINTICAQNGTFSAALVGGGLMLVDRQPAIAGMLFGLMVVKPQLGLLIPLALLAGRRWRALIAAAVTAGGLVAVSLVLFGPELWTQYVPSAQLLRHHVLENGSDIWYRMVSVFVLARTLEASLPFAYLLQAVCAIGAAAVVAILWWREAALPLRAAAVVLGTFLSTPYLFDYDLLLGVFVLAWLHPANLPDRLARPGAVAVAMLLAAPCLGIATGIAAGALMILPAFVVMTAAALPLAPTTARSDASPQPGYQILRGSSGPR